MGRLGVCELLIASSKQGGSSIQLDSAGVCACGCCYFIISLATIV